jgi:uncharacterized protein YbjT (DUF2867 family)
MSKEISVIITGATGSAGSGVLYASLKHPAVRKVSTIVRRATGKRHEKLAEIVLKDFLDYSDIQDKLAGHDACYWCLGVSQSKVRKKEDYTRITYDYTMAAAKVLGRLNPGMTFCFLSGLGTDQARKSRMMWARVKGKAEKDLGNFNFKVYNFRPGFIHPVKGQKSSTILGTILYPFIKNSAKYSVEAEDFGLAMINATLYGYEKRVLENADIRELAKRKCRAKT